MNRFAIRARVVIAVALLLVVPLARAENRTLRLDPAASRVEYHIDHTISAVTDVAGTPAGEVQVDSAGTPVAGRVTVDLRALQTGIAQRDHHIKSVEYLDVERFPKAEFVLQHAVADSNGTPSPGDAPAWRGRVTGTLRLHGVARPVEIPVALGPAGDRLRLTGHFTIRLADHGIKRPKKLVFSAGKSVDVKLDLVFAP